MEKLRLLFRKIMPDNIRRPIADRAYRLLAWGKRKRRPIADRAYRVLAWVKRVLYLFQSWISVPTEPNNGVLSNLKATPNSGQKQIKRSLSLSHIAKPVVWLYFAIRNMGYKLKAIGHRLLRARLARLWVGASKHRHLFGKDHGSLNLLQRMQRFALNILFALPDWRYRHALIHFENSLSKLPAVDSHQTHNGLLMMIGTLGPGGSERQAMLTLTGLSKRGYLPVELKCVFLRSEAQCFYLPHLESAGISVGELDRDTSDDANNKVKKLFQACQLLPASLIEVTDYARTIYNSTPSVAHLWLDEVNIKGGIAAVVLGVPRIILGMRSLPPIHFQLHQPYMREGYRWLAKQKNVIMINNSAAGAQAYEKWLGLPSGHIQVLHNGFDFESNGLTSHRANRLDYRSKHQIESDVKLIGTVIRLSEEKRPMLWLDIAAAVRRLMPGVRFLIVGDGPLRNELEVRAGEDDLKGSVYFTGYEKNVLTAMAAMDIFLLTSHSEGLPNVLVEAQALGVPVVTTDVGGAKETLAHKKTGWVLKSDDIQSTAEIIVKLLSNDAWLKEAEYSAPAYVKNEFSLTKMLDKTLTIYGGTAFSKKLPGVQCEASS